MKLVLKEQMGLVRPDLGEHYRKRYRLEIDKPESSCALNTAVFSFLDIHHKKFQGGRPRMGSEELPFCQLKIEMGPSVLQGGWPPGSSRGIG